MKFGQLVEYNIRNIFLEKSCTKSGEEASLRLFYEKSKLNISPDQQSVCSRQGLLTYIKTKVLTTCFYRGLELVFLP